MDEKKSISVTHTVIKPLGGTQQSLEECCAVDARLNDRLGELSCEGSDAWQLVNSIVDAIKRETGSESIAYLQLLDGKTARFIVGKELLERLPPESATKMAGWLKESVSSGQTTVHSLSGAHQWELIFSPVAFAGVGGAYCAAIRQGDEHSVTPGHLLQAVAHSRHWQDRLTIKVADKEANTMAALLELTSDLQRHDNLGDLCKDLANQLQSHLDAERVVIGLCETSELDCKMAAVSGLSRFDKRAELTRLVEATMNEAVLRGSVTVLSDVDERFPEGSLAHQKMMKAISAQTLITSTLVDHDEKVVGVCLVVTDRSDNETEANFIRTAQPILGPAIAATRREQASIWTRGLRRTRKLLRNNKLLAALAACLIFACAMMVPMTYQIGCACQLEPVFRRFVAAPYDGTLKESHVKPGDIVEAGQTLATMDPRELRWELSGLEADYKSERKARDAAYARDEIALAQQSDLEMKRIQVQMELLRHRLENLAVKTPIKGIVIAGDLEKSEGVPLKIGQTIFEIGPLDEMFVEVAIPERDIMYARDQMPVEITLDSEMRQNIASRVERISPRAEMRDGESVYIAEVRLDNEHGRFRPGMKGTAKIASERRRLGWILFHKAWESFAMMIGV